MRLANDPVQVAAHGAEMAGFAASLRRADERGTDADG